MNFSKKVFLNDFFFQSLLFTILYGYVTPNYLIDKQKSMSLKLACFTEDMNEHCFMS